MSRNCYAESLRLYPPAWGQPRQAIEDDVINGYKIPKGAVLAVSQWNTHRDPKYWSEPLRFDPDRFLPENSVARPKYAYFPFGGGRRLCIGQQLALLEGPLLLTSLVQRYHFEGVAKEGAAADPTFTLRPKKALKMKLVRRRG